MLILRLKGLRSVVEQSWVHDRSQISRRPLIQSQGQEPRRLRKSSAIFPPLPPPHPRLGRIIGSITSRCVANELSVLEGTRPREGSSLGEWRLRTFYLPDSLAAEPWRVDAIVISYMYKWAGSTWTWLKKKKKKKKNLPEQEKLRRTWQIEDSLG